VGHLLIQLWGQRLALNRLGLQVSIKGRGSWRDNVFIERFWRSMKYEDIYQRACETVTAAHQGIADRILRSTQRHG